MNTWQRARQLVHGFTLTELMIVISIMGALLAITAPALSRFARTWKLNGAAADMAMVMRAARSSAVNKDINVVFVFDQGLGQYFFIEDANGNGDADAGERQSTAQVLPKGVSIDDFTVPQESVTFSPRGSTSDGGTIVMKGGNREIQIRIYSGTGNIAVEPKPEA